MILIWENIETSRDTMDTLIKTYNKIMSNQCKYLDHNAA